MRGLGAIGRYRYREPKAATLKAFVNSYQDGAFMGSPILQAMFGLSSLYSVLLNLVGSLVMVPLTTMLLTNFLGPLPVVITIEHLPSAGFR